MLKAVSIQLLCLLCSSRCDGSTSLSIRKTPILMGSSCDHHRRLGLKNLTQSVPFYGDWISPQIQNSNPVHSRVILSLLTELVSRRGGCGGVASQCRICSSTIRNSSDLFVCLRPGLLTQIRHKQGVKISGLCLSKSVRSILGEAISFNGDRSNLMTA